MVTAVDTNVLLDIFFADPNFGEKSAQALRSCLSEGSVLACAVVWAEVATAFDNVSVFRDTIESLGVSFSHNSEAAAQLAGQAWRLYRNQGGKRNRIAAEFLIGAHAATHAERLLTRDRGFYKTCFRQLSVIDPSAS